MKVESQRKPSKANYTFERKVRVMKHVRWLSFFMLGMIVLLAAGCNAEPAQEQTNANANVSDASNQEVNGNGSGADSGAAAADEETLNEPVTLTFYSHYAGIVNDESMEAFFAPVQEQYPNITIERMTGMNLDEAIAAGQVPDLIATSNVYVYDMIELGLATDLSNVLSEEDWKRVHPGAIDVMKEFSENGEIYGVPYAMNYGVMVYNKGIFDRYGIDYPKAGMTFSESIELGRQLTREEDGFQIIGFDPGNSTSLTKTHSLQPVDLETGKALLNTEPFQQMFKIYEQVYRIPGFVSPEGKYSYGIDDFFKEQKLAMYPYWLVNITSRLLDPNYAAADLEWDFTSYPSPDGNPGHGREFDFHLMMVSPVTEQVEAAHQVVRYLTSIHFQTVMNNDTRLTIMQNPELRLQHASNNGLYDDKDLAAVFAVEPSPVPKSTIYDNAVYSALNEARKRIALEGIDVNTALREAAEQADKAIAEIKEGKG